ncbi:MAG: hypothetical protein MH137_05830 [Flavobacteriales bacterium]|nr:hypothetical protein [Flavobacteriales bacterium]
MFKEEEDDRPEYLFSVEQYLKSNASYLKECALAVLEDQVTNFPVFIFHKGEVTWGENITPDAEDTEWFIHLSTAEELIKRGIIELEKAKLFVAGYKNPRQFACVLAVAKEQGVSFIFYPYS